MWPSIPRELAGDPYFDTKETGTAKIYLNRSIYDSATGTTTANLQKQTYTLNYKPKPTPPASQISSGQFRNKKPPRLSWQGGFFKYENPETNF